VSGDFPTSLWTHYDNVGPHTTNVAEGWHNGLNSRFGMSHPTLRLSRLAPEVGLPVRGAVSADAAGSWKAAEAKISGRRRSMAGEDVVQCAVRAHFLRRLPVQRVRRTMAVLRCCRALSGSSELFARLQVTRNMQRISLHE